VIHPDVLVKLLLLSIT